ncbi:MAG: hypothetical protein C0453_18115 [Comamonadaceae bacterium]|nr:hypothetical protein [Comamonadaceae bacterium]
MRSTPSTHRFAAWLATLAMLMAALAPAAAQVVADARGGAGWVQVCSASGMLWVQVDADIDVSNGAPGEPMADGSGHCPWCKLGGGATGLPPVQTALVHPGVQGVQPQTHFRSATPSAVRVSAQPRAPPLA